MFPTEFADTITATSVLEDFWHLSKSQQEMVCAALIDDPDTLIGRVWLECQRAVDAAQRLQVQHRILDDARQWASSN